MQLNQEFKLDSIFYLFYTNKYNNSNVLGLQVQENINIVSKNVFAGSRLLLHLDRPITAFRSDGFQTSSV